MKRFMRRALRRPFDRYESDSTNPNHHNPVPFSFTTSAPQTEISPQISTNSTQSKSLSTNDPQSQHKPPKRRHSCLPAFTPFSTKRHQQQLTKHSMQNINVTNHSQKQPPAILPPPNHKHDPSPSTNVKKVSSNSKNSNQISSQKHPSQQQDQNKQKVVKTAPVFYDMNDTPVTSNDDTNYTSNHTNTSNIDSNSSTIPFPPDNMVSDVSIAEPVDLDITYPSRNQSIEVIVEEDPEFNQPHSSSRLTEETNDTNSSRKQKYKKHHKKNHSNKRQLSATNIITTSKSTLNNIDDYDNDTNDASTLKSLDDQDSSLRTSSNSGRRRRVKTTLGKSIITSSKDYISPDINRYESSIRDKIDESPFLKEKSARSKLDCDNYCDSKIYHAYTDALHREARGSAGGLRTIIELLRNCEENPIIIEKAALVIGILSENDAATRDVFGQYSAVQSLLQCLSIRMPAKYDRSKLVQSIIYAISCLLQDSPRNARLFEMFQGPHKLGKSAASERYEDCADIPKHALKSLSELKHYPLNLSDCYSRNQLSNSLSSCATTSRTIRYVLRAMSLHEHRLDIQEHGLDALRTLLGRIGKGMLKSSILELSAQTTTTAFKLHKESSEIQWQCLSLFCDLDELREDVFLLHLDVNSFFEALRLLTKTDGDEQNEKWIMIKKNLLPVIRRAVDVAVNNGWRNHEFKDAAVDANGVDTMLQVLHTFGDDTQVVDKICTILRMLLQTERGRQQLSNMESAKSILAAVERFNMKAANLTPI